MDADFGRDKAVYGANRWFVGLIVVVAGGAGVVLLHPALHHALRAINFRSSSAFLNVVPPDLRIIGLQACGALLVVTALALCRYLISPRIVRIDDKGIEVRQYFSTRRGRWRDFGGMNVVGRLGKTVQLRFKKSQGFNTTVTLPAKLLGVDNRAVVADLASRLSTPKTVIVPGSLDKYDPKKLAAAAAATAVEIEIVVQANAEPQPEEAIPSSSAPPTPRRRTFGRR